MLKKLLKKIKNVKSTEDFFIKIFGKFDNLLIYPKNGFTRMHVDKFMELNFLHRNT